MPTTIELNPAMATRPYDGPWRGLPVSSPNPVPCRIEEEDERGSLRNLWCPLYDDCLDLAVNRSYPDFSCRSCPYKCLADQPQAHEMEAGEPVGWEEIWKAGVPV